MIALIKELNTTSKKAPKKVRAITLYNIVNFISTLVLTAGFSIFTVFMAPQITSEVQMLMIFLPLAFVAINYYVLLVNKRFIYGSERSYWILLILMLVQCVAIRVGGYSFELNLGGIPLSFSLTLGNFFLRINFAAVIFTSYLIGVKEEFFEYAQALKAHTANQVKEL